jgi:hypothetical protein
MRGPVENKVGIGRDTGANRKEGACHSLARWEKDNMRLGQGLASDSPDISGMWLGGQGKKYTGRNGTE